MLSLRSIINKYNLNIKTILKLHLPLVFILVLYLIFIVLMATLPQTEESYFIQVLYVYIHHILKYILALLQIIIWSVLLYKFLKNRKNT